MKNKSLVEDYIIRAGYRLEALTILLQRKSYADVVREAQEIVELSLKALLRFSHIENPRLHDVSEVLQQEESKLPLLIKTHLKKLCQISKSLRRDRELSFYGAEDVTPSEFYQEEDAKKAFKDATWVYETCHSVIQP